MTPLHIRIAIHYLCHPYPYAENEPEHRYSRATTQYTRELVRAGLLIPRTPDKDPKGNTSDYDVSTGLRQYVDALCAVPLPKLDVMWTHPMVESVVAEPIERG